MPWAIIGVFAFIFILASLDVLREYLNTNKPSDHKTCRYCREDFGSASKRTLARHELYCRRRDAPQA